MRSRLLTHGFVGLLGIALGSLLCRAPATAKPPGGLEIRVVRPPAARLDGRLEKVFRIQRVVDADGEVADYQSDGDPRAWWAITVPLPGGNRTFYGSEQ
ncbi:MAG: hypothetical protein JWO38_2306 [Gemmataceae bacterium]|nr:hypothetical protein [Gemmataceae bacterium]